MLRFHIPRTYSQIHSPFNLYISLCVSITLHYTIYNNTNILYLGTTSLHWAALHGHTDIVKILLENGINVSTTDKDGKSLNYSQDYCLT